MLRLSNAFVRPSSHESVLLLNALELSVKQPPGRCQYEPGHAQRPYAPNGCVPAGT